MTGKDADNDVTQEAPESVEENQAQAPEEGNAELDALIAEAVSAALAEQQDSVLRAQAEVQNMRRRCEIDVEKAHKFALEKFSAELLTVIDNLERAWKPWRVPTMKPSMPCVRGWS